MADFYKAAGQHVEQKAANELRRLESHDGGLARLAIVLPAKAHLVVLQRYQAPVRDRHAMGITRQVLQDLVRSAKWWFGVNHPLALDYPV